MLKLTLLLLSNKAMLIWSVRNHLIVIVIITCCFVIHCLNSSVLKQVCFFVIQWLPLENVESGQINLRCTWFTLTPKPEDLSPVSGHYSCHTIDVLSVAHVGELVRCRTGGSSNFERTSVACHFLFLVVLSDCNSVSNILKMIKVAYGSGRLRNF